MIKEEEESDKEQIRDARADYKAGRFTRVRALIKEGLLEGCYTCVWGEK